MTLWLPQPRPGEHRPDLGVPLVDSERPKESHLGLAACFPLPTPSRSLVSLSRSLREKIDMGEVTERQGNAGWQLPRRQSMGLFSDGGGATGRGGARPSDSIAHATSRLLCSAVSGLPNSCNLLKSMIGMRANSLTVKIVARRSFRTPSKRRHNTTRADLIGTGRSANQ